MATIKDIAKDRGYNLHQLSEMVGLSYGALHRAATKEEPEIKLSTAYKLAKALDMSLDDFYLALTDQLPVNGLKEGWNDIHDGLSVFVENGKIMRGVHGNDTVYPYVKSNIGGYSNAVGTPKEKFDILVWF